MFKQTVGIPHSPSPDRPSTRLTGQSTSGEVPAEARVTQAFAGGLHLEASARHMKPRATMRLQEAMLALLRRISTQKQVEGTIGGGRLIVEVV